MAAVNGQAPPSVCIVLGMETALAVAGVVAGGLWGAVPGLLKAYRGINEIITTLLSVYVAIELNNYLTQVALKPLNAVKLFGLMYDYNERAGGQAVGV